MINPAFGKSAGSLSIITVVQDDRMPIVEIDGYPPEATVRPGNTSVLSSGNALVTPAIERADFTDVECLVLPRRHDGELYMGRISSSVPDPAGEPIDLIETGLVC